MLIAINRSMRRVRSRALLLVAVLLLSGSVVLAHGAMGAGHMSAAMPAMGMAGAEMTGGHAPLAAEGGSHLMLAMCLAIAETAAFALGALALGLAMRALRRRLTPAFWPPQPQYALPAVARIPRARPPDLSLLQVFRR